MTAGNISTDLYIAAAVLVGLGMAVGLFGRSKPYRAKTANIASTMLLIGVLSAGAALVINPLGPWLLGLMRGDDSSGCDVNPTSQALCDHTPNQTLPPSSVQPVTPSPGIPSLNN